MRPEIRTLTTPRFHMLSSFWIVKSILVLRIVLLRRLRLGFYAGVHGLFKPDCNCFPCCCGVPLLYGLWVEMVVIPRCPVLPNFRNSPNLWRVLTLDGGCDTWGSMAATCAATTLGCQGRRYRGPATFRAALVRIPGCVGSTHSLW